MNRHDYANARHAPNLPIAQVRPSVPGPDWRLRNPVLQRGDAACERPAAVPIAAVPTAAAHVSTRHQRRRPRQRARRRVRQRRLSPRRDRREPNRQAPSPPATQTTRSTRRSPREPLSTLQTTPHDDPDAPRSHRMKIAICSVRPTSPSLAEASRIGMEAARSDERLRGGTAPAVVTEKTPEASLSRESAFGSIDSPGRLTRRAPRLSRDAQLTVAGQRRSLTGFPGRILMNTTRLERYVNQAARGNGAQS